MAEQATWIPLPKRRLSKVKTGDALQRVGRLADWYLANKPSVKRISVTRNDYKAFEEAVGTSGITINDSGIHYRDFLIQASD